VDDIQERVARCFANVFPNVPKEEIARASTASLASWDSVAQVTLLSAIGEEFGLGLEVEDFEELVSYALIVDYVETRIH
jgi:acyl carrier protein